MPELILSDASSALDVTKCKGTVKGGGVSMSIDFITVVTKLAVPNVRLKTILLRDCGSELFKSPSNVRFLGDIGSTLTSFFGSCRFWRCSDLIERSYLRVFLFCEGSHLMYAFPDLEVSAATRLACTSSSSRISQLNARSLIRNSLDDGRTESN